MKIDFVVHTLLDHQQIEGIELAHVLDLSKLVGANRIHAENKSAQRVRTFSSR